MNYHDFIFPYSINIANIVAQGKTMFETICLLISSAAPALAILISIYVYFDTNAKSSKSGILKMNDKLLDLSIQYPYLESDSYCDEWTGEFSNDESKLRYNIYCCKVYNLLIELYDFCGGDYKKMSNIIDIDDYIKTHHVWLSLESDKTIGNEKFNSFIHDRILALINNKKEDENL